MAYPVNLSIDELLSNTIGFDDDETHRIAVVVRLEQEALVVVIVDNGAAFDPTRMSEPDIEAPLKDRDLGGPSLLLVNRTMDRVVDYYRRAGCNVVTQTKNAAAVSKA